MDSYHIHLEGMGVYLTFFFFLNSRSGSLIPFTTMAKGYEQVAMTKMVFPTEHFISIRQCCCKISGLEIMPAVSTGVAHAAAAS